MTTQDSSDSNAIAIVGMAGRFPLANDLQTFWTNLRNGVESVQTLTDDELRKAGVDDATLSDPNYIKVASMLSGFETFDAEFFDIAPREAEVMDPQHRLFLEVAWEAVEHAGYDVRDYPGAIGLFAGTAISNYLFANILSNPRAIESMGDRHVVMVNDKDFLCGRVAYELNLRGPAVVVQTACSTSLVAVHMACQSILNGECDMALAGGVSIQGLERVGYTYYEGGLQSADGHCRAFDANATGIVSGSGLGIVVLKSLSAARADGDTIHAIIRGSAINNDGKDKASFTAPSVSGQAAVIREAQAMAGVPVESISYIEAHGTGTMLGDPIEMRALTQAFGEETQRTQFCAVGSLKTNMGHLDIAAGVAGLMKTVLALQHREIPPSLHYTAPNPHIDFANSAFFVNNALRSWESPDGPRRAGVSSFGIGGTNAHVILEEAPRALSAPSRQPCHVLLLSAKSPKALDAAARNLADHLEQHPTLEPADVAHTLRVGRQSFAYRRGVSCRNLTDAIEGLRQPHLPQRVQTTASGDAPPIVFLFPGGGTQYLDMGKALYQTEAVFRGVIDECARLLEPILGIDLIGLLFPDAHRREEASALLDRTHYMLPALFAIEYGLVKQFEAWGIRPAAMVGHSLGEYVAATVAGVFSLRDALYIVSERGRLISSLPTGNMLAVLQSPAQLQPRLGEGLWLACENASDACTIAGTPEATERLAEELAAEGVDFQLLRTWPGSHSGLMEPILDDFRAVFDGIQLHAPTLPYLSNLTGDWIRAEQACDPEYWVGHLHQPVRFGSALRRLLQNTANIYLEIGTGHTLSNLLKREISVGRPLFAITTLPRRDAGTCSVLAAYQALGQLWSAGCDVDWAMFYTGEARRRLPLPTYPFQRKRYWLENRQRELGIPGNTNDERHHDAIETRTDEGGDLDLHDRPLLPTEFVAPRTSTEQALAASWQGLLGIAPVGVDDDFFLLGGTSLIAIQLASRIRAGFSVDMPLRTLFETPTIAAQAREIERRLGNDTPRSGTAIVPRPLNAATPASFSQQRLWFVDQLDHAASVAFHIPFAMRLTGCLDQDALQATLDRIVDRHESQRTRILKREGDIVQVIDPPGIGFDLRTFDLRGQAPGEQDIAVGHHCAEEFSALFDLADGPLSRGRLLRLADDEHILLITQHHIVSDGWSIGVLIREVMTLYAAFTRGESDPLPPLTLQYADYAIWQRAQLQGERAVALREFWVDYLADAPTLLALPTDRPRPPVQSHEGASIPFELDVDLAAALKVFCQQHGCTLFMAVLAAWSIALSRASGEPDIVIGTPVANRQRDEVESMIGFFVNTLPLRVRLDRATNVGQLLDQVKSATLRAYEHQELPFEQIVDALQPERSISYSPLFQVMLNLHNTPNYRQIDLPGLTVGEVEQAQHTAQYDLLLSIADQGERIAGDLRYATALFDAPSIERMVKQFTDSLRSMLADTGLPLEAIDLVDDRQRQRLLGEFNAPSAVLDQGRFVQSRFEALAETQPDAVALVYGGQVLSYGELNRRANRLAHRLIELGVRPEDRVAVCLDRGIDRVVGLLGVLKSGGGYVPLDPDYPVERLRYMLQDCGPKLLLTQGGLASRIAGDMPLAVVSIDAADESGAMASQPESSPDPLALGLGADSLAYVIYTSGSTGLPKGVVNEHGGLFNLALAQIDAFAVTPESRVLQFASCSFDASISEVMMALCSGAALHLATREDSWPGEPLRRTIHGAGITHLTLPPAALSVMGEPEALAPMTLVVAGDACPPALARDWARRHAVFNAYGPTEATVCASIHRVTAEDVGRLPIGTPMANVQIHLLDATQKLVPLGAIGEICIGGTGVARGYLDRPDLNSDRFIRDPFTAGSVARLYRSGDLGRWREDGSLEFLGRRDGQVKLRGFRIELGEIENQLLACPGVREAVAVVREDVPGDKRLVAYYCIDDEAGNASTSTATALRQHLAAAVPEYMVPSVLVALPALPLSANGKLDRKLLPAPTHGDTGRDFEPPEGPFEEQLAQLWSELLGTPRIGRSDNFFELGGHSLLAVQLLARIHEVSGVELTLSSVFQAPTLASMADVLIDAELSRFGEDDLALASAQLDALSDDDVERLLSSEAASTRLQ